MPRRFINWLVDTGGRFPYIVLGLALVFMAGTWAYAWRIELRSDFMELLPRDSPGFRAFEHQMGRVGGGATLLVITESPDRHANERLVDELAGRLERRATDQRACWKECGAGAKCQKKCGALLVSYVESGTKEVRKFFDDNKWLYADVADLQDADRTLDQQIAMQSGMVEKLDDDAPPATDGRAPTAGEKKPALGMGAFRDRWKKEANKNDDFPTGYFATPDGKMVGLRIVSNSAGTGDSSGDALLKEVTRMIEDAQPRAFHPEMKVGLAGDIPNAVAEKESLVSEAAWVTGLAFVLILAGVVWFYRSFWALAVVGFPPVIGVGCAYAFATATYGYVNTSGAFLGAIILGNGVNYPIVLYSRYREFRGRGMTPETARREAVWNAFRAELVGASVASIAYGSLTFTQFRGFSQFGMIGFVGMILVWFVMIPCVPAAIVVTEQLQSKLPLWMRQTAARVDADGSRGPVSRFIGDLAEKHPWVIVGTALVVTVVTASALPNFLRDPWEYNFAKLGSRGSQQSGAGDWSLKAEKVFGGKMNVSGALMLADTPEQTPKLKAQILENDSRDIAGPLIAEVATVNDLLPASAKEQEKKLAVLDRIRARLTPGVVDELPPEERQTVEELRPPEQLRPIEPRQLPDLLRRRFEEKNGVVGTVFYVKYRDEVSLSDGKNLLRIAKTTDNVVLPDQTHVQTASRSSIFAEMIRSMERDGPRATLASFAAVAVVVLLATYNARGAFAVLIALVLGVVWTLGGAALMGEKLNFLNFIALPITFGIGSEYPFNIYDRARLLGGDVTAAVKLHLGAVSLCSYTTVIGYGSLMFADNQALQSFGRLATAGEIACLLAAIFLLPSILHLLRRRGVPIG